MIPPVPRRKTGGLSEQLAEIGLIHVADPHGDFPNAQFWIAQKLLAFANPRFDDRIENALARFSLENVVGLLGS